MLYNKLNTNTKDMLPDKKQWTEDITSRMRLYGITKTLLSHESGISRVTVTKALKGEGSYGIINSLSKIVDTIIEENEKAYKKTHRIKR